MSRDGFVLDDSIVEIPRGDNHRLVIQCLDYRGFPYLGVRVWYLDRGGKWCPGNKGLTVRRSEVAAVVEALLLAKRMFGDAQDGPELES